MNRKPRLELTWKRVVFLRTVDKKPGSCRSTGTIDASVSGASMLMLLNGPREQSSPPRPPSLLRRRRSARTGSLPRFSRTPPDPPAEAFADTAADADRCVGAGNEI